MSIVLLALCNSLQAQNDTSIKRNNTLVGSINYQSRLHFFGRVDSLSSSGLFPSIGFETKLGIYGNSSFIFVGNQQQPHSYAGTIAEVGYKFPETRNFSGNVFYNHFFYNKDVELVQAALRGQTGVNLTYNNKIVNVTAGGDLKFSDRTDIGATLGLDHLFIYVIPKTKMAIAVNPSAYLYSGTQNFTQTYRKRQTVAGLPIGGQTLVSENVQQFNVLAYELSLPVVFVAGKFNATLTGSYVSPQNLVTVPNRPSESELGKKMFYVSASVGFRL